MASGRPPGRPNEYKDPARPFLITCEKEDLKHIDDHKGKLSRGKYLTEKMYSDKGNDARIVAVITENKQLKQEIQDLKRQLLFEQSKNKKQVPEDKSKTVIQIRNELKEKWFNTRGKEFIDILNRGEEPPWETERILSQSDYPNAFHSSQEMKYFVNMKRKSNGGIA